MQPTIKATIYSSQQQQQIHDNPLCEEGPLPAYQTPVHTLSRYFKPNPRRRKWTTVVKFWVQSHPWIATAIALLLLIAIILAIVLGICSATDCRGLTLYKNGGSAGQDTEPYQDVPRLLVTFNNVSIDALDVLPSVLRPYIDRIRLQTSNIQLLNFLDEDTLAAARSYLQANPDLDLLTRDFGMAALPSVIGSTQAAGQLTQALDYLRSAISQPWNQYVSGDGRSTGDGSPSRRQLFDSQQGDDRMAQAEAWGHHHRSATRRQLITEPNDPLYANGTQWYMNRVGVASAWSVGTASPDVIVAIIDSGVDLTHPDLAANLWTNTKEIPGNGIDDDGNGFIDDVHGWDFAGGCTPTANNPTCTISRCRGQAKLADSSNHGTGVAGLVAAVMNNRQGGVGVAPGVKLMVLRVSDCVDGTIYASAAVAAFDYAARMGAHVIQASFGAYYPYGYRPQAAAPWYHAGWNKAYTTAIQPLAAQGILVVAAAGNEALDMDLMLSLGYSYCPCLIQLPNVLCVTSSEPDDSLSPFSNYGNRSVHLAAPGRVLVTTTTGATYAPLTGSSFSAPLVTGVAALALSVLGAADGNYSRAYQAKKLLMSATVVPATGSLPCTSGGRVSANNTVTAALLVATNATGNASGGNGTYLVPVAATLNAPGSLSNNSTANQAYTPDPQTPSAMASGFTERYYKVPAGWVSLSLPSLTQMASLALVDQTVRPGPNASFQSFKYPSGFILSIQSLMYLGQPGVWTFRVSTLSVASSYRLIVGGQTLPLTDAGRGAVLALGAGLYSVELQLMPPYNPVTILVRAPAAAGGPAANSSSLSQQPDASAGSADWVVMSACYNVAFTRYQPSAFGPAMSPSSHYEASLLARGWYLRYNLTRFRSSPGSADAATASASGLPLTLPKSMAWFLTSSTASGASLPLLPPLASATGGRTQQQPAPRFMRSAHVPDMAFTADNVLQWHLLPQGIAGLAPDSVIAPGGSVASGAGEPGGQPVGITGWASTVLRTSQLPAKIVIRVMCRSCALLLNDLPVLDGWDPSAATTTSTTPSYLLPARISGCISLSPGEMIRLSLFFAASDVTVSPLVMGWATCDSADQGVFQQFSDAVMTPDLWDINTANTGRVPGVQCDVWPSDRGMQGPGSADVGLVPALLTTATGRTTAWGSWFSRQLTPQQGPQLKARLPAALCGGSDTCIWPWAFSLEALFPGLSSAASATHGPNALFDVRCWTYWSGGFRNGPRAAPGTNASSSNQLPTSVYLAGQQVWSSSWPGVVIGSQSQPAWASVAPNTTTTGSTMQLLTVEWFSVESGTNLVLLDGNQIVVMRPGSTQLPLAPAGDVSASPPLGSVTVGPAGHHSVTLTPDSQDLTPLVESDLCGLGVQGEVDTSNAGLNLLAAYSSTASTRVRYSAVYGFLLNLQNSPVTLNVTVNDSYASSTSVHAAGVTLLNGRQFSLDSLSEVKSFSVTLPAGAFTPVAVVVKTGRLDSRAQYAVSVQGYNAAVFNGPVTQDMWFRAVVVAAAGAQGVAYAGNESGLGVL